MTKVVIRILQGSVVTQTCKVGYTNVQGGLIIHYLVANFLSYSRCLPVHVWSRSSHLPARRSDFREITKVSVSRDLDLKDNLDAGSSGNHRVQVWWRFSHFCDRRSDLRKSLQTDDARLH